MIIMASVVLIARPGRLLSLFMKSTLNWVSLKLMEFAPGSAYHNISQITINIVNIVTISTISTKKILRMLAKF